MILTGLVALAWLTGCAHRYVVVFSRGNEITAVGKPRLDKSSNCYVFTDAKGQQQIVPAASVREIAPASMHRDPRIPSAQTIQVR